MTPAGRHRSHARRFGDRVRGVPPGGWEASSPVAEWCARDVVEHLITWLPGFLQAGADLRLAPGPPVGDDPGAAWAHHATSVQRLLDDGSTASRTFALPQVGELPLAEAIDRFYTTDVLLHTWDLARATGQDAQLPAAECDALLAGMEPMEDVLRASGQYGPAVPVAEDADVVARLMAFLGRDPDWSPGG